MKKWFFLTALCSAALTLLVVNAAAPAHSVKLENARVRVTEENYTPGEPRPRAIRQHAQVIVFVDDCRYERLDSETHQKTIRQRKSGYVIWHDKGEDAPQLTNL